MRERQSKQDAAVHAHTCSTDNSAECVEDSGILCGVELGHMEHQRTLNSLSDTSFCKIHEVQKLFE